MTTTEQHYNAYMTTALAIAPLKAQLKAVKAQGEQAAVLAKNTTVGSVPVRISAIRDAWAPFNQQIAEIEQKIIDAQATADKEFDAYRGL